MRHAGHYRTGAVRVLAEMSVAEVAERMDSHGVGSVVVVDAERRPVGIVTDRDLLCRVVARGGDAAKTNAGDVMTPRPATGSVEEPIETLLERMREHRVRRLPIVEEGVLVGLVSLDDLISELARELGDLREAWRAEVLGGRREARSRRRREHLEEVFEDVRSEVVELGSRSLEWLEREVAALRKRVRR